MNAFDSGTDAIAELRYAVQHRLEHARAMPASVYTSQAVAEAEIERIFRREWVSVGRASQLAKPGDFLCYDLAGQPIVVLRDHEGRLRAQSNVCLHRMSTLLSGSGNVRSIVCPYHAWTYGLDGRLRGAPGMGRNCAFRRQDYRLQQIRCEEWFGWIMITLDDDAPPVADRLRGVERLIADFGMERYVQSFQEQHRWNTNWKVLAENFMESYHLPVCHAPTIGGYVRLEEMECPEGEETFNYHWLLKDPSFFLSCAHPANARLEGDRRRTTYLLTIYPSLLITLTPGYFWYLILQPNGPAHVSILYGGGMAPEFADDPRSATHFAELKALLDRVNDEDKGCTEAVYRGLSSPLARPGHMSHLERPLHEFARYIAARLGG